jgi:demethylmenaquinone methyltransferase/2-methoxy-6-polyprenyl-1,4-benzoquinol methylase
MTIKQWLFENQSENNMRVFNSMLKWLDGSFRRTINDPDKLVEGSGIQPGQKVLEIGCGSGYFTIPAALHLGENGQLVSVDLHPAAVAETQRKVDAAGLTNVIVQREDALHTSFDDQSFDLVLLYGVVPAPVVPTAEVSREIHRLLKPGGMYAIWTMVPLWKPVDAIKAASFKELPAVNGVFRLQKI